MLGGVEGIDVAGEAGSGTAAVDLIEESRPHLVFLDIQMPDYDGFEVVRRLTPPRPEVIFVTAYDAFALRAFALHALDYLLKPFTRERFADAVAHARTRLERRRGADLDPLVADLHRARPYLARVSVRRGGRLVVVPLTDVTRIEAADNYVSLHTAGGEFLLRETINRVEARLDPAIFLRVHRSTIVRLDRIVSLDARGRGDYDVVLKDRGPVAVGRSYRASVLRALRRR
jgi:two-component system LytT family response regulator